ncbi:hypothetical protein BD779DRAFT_1671993 [Infundibulicybe gibba]|nr:hypothetical protein BD779DRAFT_1671993 [Infundibulicybe gibba]
MPLLALQTVVCAPPARQVEKFGSKIRKSVFLTPVTIPRFGERAIALHMQDSELGGLNYANKLEIFNKGIEWDGARVPIDNGVLLAITSGMPE